MRRELCLRHMADSRLCDCIPHPCPICGEDTVNTECSAECQRIAKADAADLAATDGWRSRA